MSEQIDTYDPATFPDVTEQDTLAERVAEAFPALGPQTRAAIAAFIAAEAREHIEREAAERFRRLLEALYSDKKQTPEQVAFAFAANLDGLNPFKTMQEAGQALGMTRANISRKALIIREALGLPTGTHQKTDAARANQAAARRRFCELKKNLTENAQRARQIDGTK